jgi:hypothetical protein
VNGGAVKISIEEERPLVKNLRGDDRHEGADRAFPLPLSRAGHHVGAEFLGRAFLLTIEALEEATHLGDIGGIDRKVVE